MRTGAACRGRRAAIVHPTLLQVLLASILLCGVGAAATKPAAAHTAAAATNAAAAPVASAPPVATNQAAMAPSHHDHISPGGHRAQASRCTVFPLLLAAAVAVLAVVSAAHPALQGDIRRLAAPFALGFTGVLYSIIRLGVPLEYWAHVMFGVVCLAAGAIVERTGQPVRVHLVQGGLVACIFVSLIAGEYLSVGFGRLHYVAHALLELDCLLLTLSAVSESLVAAAPSTASRTVDEGVALKAALLRVRTARCVVDPCGLASIGVIFLRHQHDPGALAIAFHHVQAGLLLLLALAVASVAAAAAQPVARRSLDGGAAGPALRALHALCWFVNGAWLILMAVLMYLWPGRRGLHHLVYPAEDPGEATSVYFALTLLVSALAVAFLTLRERRAELASQLAAELKDADELSGAQLLGPALP
jgi:hypothetical protein